MACKKRLALISLIESADGTFALHIEKKKNENALHILDQIRLKWLLGDQITA